MTREVLLVGSIPLRPASRVFETVAAYLGALAPRIPDGEQIGWIHAARRTIEANPALELHRNLKHNGRESVEVPFFRLKQGMTARDLKLGPYGYASNAIDSYRQFRELRHAGKIPARARFQATLPGPGTSVFYVALSPKELLPIARAALLREVVQMTAAIPAKDLALQLDIAMEAEHEEWLRRPGAFDTPVHEGFHWTQEQMAESVAWLANRVPPEVELGFHICSIWHHYPDAGQDNAVLVDTANAISRRVTRPVSYFHIPLIPEHEESDYAELKRLDLRPGTKLYLGLLNFSDGMEGARSRIAMARTVVPDFGIAWYCGLGRPTEGHGSGSPLRPPAIPALRRATADTIGEALELHRQAALYR